MNLFKLLLTMGIAAFGVTLPAATISLTDNFSGAADWTKSVIFSKFDPSLGTLTSLDFQLNTQMAVASTLRNTGAGSQNFQFQISEDVSFHDGASILTGDAVSATALTPFTLAGGGTTTLTTNVVGVNSSFVGITTPSVLAAFTGVGSVTFTLASLTGATTYGGGGLITASNAPVISGTAVMTYHYTPPAPPGSQPPALGIAVYSNRPVLFYPTAGNSTFIVQMNTNLTSTNWVTVSNYVPMTCLMVSNVPGNAFFRLHKISEPGFFAGALRFQCTAAGGL